MAKKFPDLKTDEEADDWLQSADLTDYDLSEMKKVRFELAPKDASISLRLPAALLATLKARAAAAEMPTQRFIRVLIEAQLSEGGAKAKRKPAGKATRRWRGRGSGRRSGLAARWVGRIAIAPTWAYRKSLRPRHRQRYPAGQPNNGQCNSYSVDVMPRNVVTPAMP